MDYSRIINLIKESDYVEFADYGDGIADEWIYKAEARLGLKLPDSYKWWLKCYSGGEISGEEIYSIYEMDFDSVRGGYRLYVNR
ncbi:SMI1/KNR4 family protein [Pseudomonas sp. CBR-F]